MVMTNAGFDLPVGYSQMREEASLNAPPVPQKNFISKWIDSFSNTVIVWIESAGKIHHDHTPYKLKI